ncbi:hypothetical protein CANARDRAFT_9369 [[Candida] arabinofermentans NRRL YB-2248]|uniref:Uncharacterized protein n=1 Tax=[Candida] arabinofermentans NRRL YB-2248 TaxID=983967 RepID=A0A1E4SVL6_9ASCO|nr:hypothetical protein CANARDRAFT_9369 [[Candida] arabinofermentans NRRL YB-2248]
MTEVITQTYSDIKLLDKVNAEGFPIVEVPEYNDTRTLKVTAEDLTVSEPVTPEKITEKLKIYGGCFVRNYLPEDVCDQILADVRPHLDSFRPPGDDEFIAQTTKRVSGTCVKSKTAAEKFLAHPLNIAVSNKFLGKENVFRMGVDEVVGGYSAAQHNSCITFSISPGSSNQILHKDDITHHNIKKHQDEYTFGTETALGTVLALKKTTKENGATRFIPGSHLWDHYREPHDEDVVYAELEKGDCFFMLASCYHGGSANVTKDEERIVCILFMTQGTLRQEENIFLGTPIEYFKSLSIDALKALGLQMSQPYCGYWENFDPISLLKPDDEYHHPQFRDHYRVAK